MALASLVAMTEVKHHPGGVSQWGEGAFKVGLKS